MRYAYLIGVLLIEFLLLKTLKLLDNPGLLIFLFALILATGLLLTTLNKSGSKIVKDLGWGMLFASLFTILLVIGFLIWLSFNFPG